MCTLMQTKRGNNCNNINIISSNGNSKTQKTDMNKNASGNEKAERRK